VVGAVARAAVAGADAGVCAGNAVEVMATASAEARRVNFMAM